MRLPPRHPPLHRWAGKIGPTPRWVRLAVPLLRRLPAGRYRIMEWLCRNRPAVFLARMPSAAGQFSFRCDLGDLIAREVCFTGCYEPQETTLVQTILRPGMTFVDVGANWG